MIYFFAVTVHATEQHPTTILYVLYGDCCRVLSYRSNLFGTAASVTYSADELGGTPMRLVPVSFPYSEVADGGKVLRFTVTSLQPTCVLCPSI